MPKTQRLDMKAKQRIAVLYAPPHSLGIVAIASRMGCSPKHVAGVLEELGVKRRTSKQSQEKEWWRG